MCALSDSAAIGTAGLPVVAINSDTAISASNNIRTHTSFLANHGFGITQALTMRFMQFLDESRTHH